ncbi:MAG: hypothetical protein U1E46_00670 [Hyphomicrobiales bacterium]
MKRLLALICFCVLLPIVPIAHAASEIGYVEDFAGPASGYRVIRSGTEVAMTICLPLMGGDKVQVIAPNGRIVLRLAGRSDPVVRTARDNETPLEETPGSTTYWSAVFDWAVATLSPLDEQRRERISTTIRDDGGGDFGVPLLRSLQTMAAGERSISIGWTKPSQPVLVSLSTKSGKQLVSGKGVGGLWTSPLVSLKPGSYRLEVAAPGAKVIGRLEVVKPQRLPDWPKDLANEDGSDPLAAAARALWLASQGDGAYALEAFQRVARSQPLGPTAVVRAALINGARINPPEH